MQKNIKRNLLIVGAAVVIAGYAVFKVWLKDAFEASRKSMEPEQIMQCVGATGPYGDAHPELTKGLVIDTQRKCYVLRWSIPRAYMAYLSGPASSDHLNLTIGISDLTPGAYLSEERISKEMPNITIHSNLSYTYEKRIAISKEGYVAGYGIKPTGRVMYDMEIYETTKADVASAVVMFHSKNPMLPTVMCHVGRNGGVDQINPYTPCNVRSKIDDRLYAEYYIVYSLMPQFEKINVALVGRIRSFIVQ